MLFLGVVGQYLLQVDAPALRRDRDVLARALGRIFVAAVAPHQIASLAPAWSVHLPAARACKRLVLSPGNAPDAE